jgi:acyl-CoA synthetase (AMP-forming)/AMP-acid ligase II
LACRPCGWGWSSIWTPPAKLPSLKRIIVGGAPMPPALMERIERRLGVTVQTSWGMTELSPSAPSAAERSARSHAALSGRPAIGVDLMLTDAERSPLPSSAKPRGICMCAAPRSSSAISARSPATDAEGWFATGDLARIDAKGNLIITGRAKDLIKSGGEWINPAEIEAVVGAARRCRWPP